MQDSSVAERYTVGVDFGTLSGRAVVVRVSDGAEVGSAVYDYPDGVIDSQLPITGTLLPPDWALQNPADWLAVLGSAVPAAVTRSGIDPGQIVAIGTDFTASTVLPTDASGTPLCELSAFREQPHAWPKLWKHHAAHAQADRINDLAHQRNELWIGRYGGKISSEWEFAKALQVLEEAPDVYDATRHWIEAADWIVWQLTGVESRNSCTAGYKGIFQDGAYPSHDFLAALNPAFEDFADTRLSTVLSPLGGSAGQLTEKAAALTGLRTGTVVSVGNVDAHVSAAAARAVEPGRMLAVMGTSTCHVMSSTQLGEVPGMCGVVDGGIVAGMYGYEAGQSGVGDIFAWWVQHNVPAAYFREAEARDQSIHQYLTDLTADEPVGRSGLLALDWMNGNRSILVDHRLSGVILGLTLATRPEEVYRALLESTAFGTRCIVEAFGKAGVPVEEFVAAGGLLQNKVLMQLYSDVLGMPITTAVSTQGPALGSAIHAAVAAGVYPDVRAAADVMGSSLPNSYVPDPLRSRQYDALYAEYLRLHDYFGRPESAGGNEVMHRLRELRDAVA